jgi:hypothetical protein
MIGGGEGAILPLVQQEIPVMMVKHNASKMPVAVAGMNCPEAIMPHVISPCASVHCGPSGRSQSIWTPAGMHRGGQ